jgi:hypothetical protein
VGRYSGTQLYGIDVKDVEDLILTDVYCHATGIHAIDKDADQHRSDPSHFTNPDYIKQTDMDTRLDLWEVEVICANS